MKRITIRDAYTIALALEKIGQAYYRKAMTITNDEKIKKLFESLALQEVGHEAYYKQLIEDLDKNENNLPACEIEAKSAEAISKDTTLIETLRELQAEVFDNKKIDEKIHNIKSLDAFIDMAIENEQRVVTFFTRIKTYINPKFATGINKIIEEEKSHVLQLINFRKTIENALR